MVIPYFDCSLPLIAEEVFPYHFHISVKNDILGHKVCEYINLNSIKFHNATSI